MNVQTVTNGEQLIKSILLYTQAVISKKQKNVVIFLSLVLLPILLYFLDVGVQIQFIQLLGGGFIVGCIISLVGYIGYRRVYCLLSYGICLYYRDTDNNCTIVDFFVPVKQIIHRGENSEMLLRTVIRMLMPQLRKNSHKLHVEIYPIAPIIVENNNSIMKELEKIVEIEVNNNSSELPIDIKEKGKIMSKAYLTLYCIENTLRLFIESELRRMPNPLNITSGIRRKIQERKENEQKNKYLSVRGGNDLFYMDFKELSDIIVNNPSLLAIFPNEHWIRVKIEELGNIRNLIAHNSYIGELEMKIIVATYESILKQIKK